MAKQHPRDFAFGQWFLTASPAAVGLLFAVAKPLDIQFPMTLYCALGGLAVSAGVFLLNVYGEDL